MDEHIPSHLRELYEESERQINDKILKEKRNVRKS